MRPNPAEKITQVPDATNPVGPGQGLSPLNDREKQINDDYDWCLNDPQVRRTYGGQVVAVYQRRILGAGINHAAAREAARRQPACPSQENVVFVVVPEADSGTVPS